MSKALQAKMLRAVEAGEVRRIGENDSRRIDVRFVAATNVDLKGAVDAGDFRSDLYYRLNVHRVHMPPLRERPGDLRPLVDHFLERYRRGHRRRRLRRAGVDSPRGLRLSGERPSARAHHPARRRDRAGPAARAGRSAR